MTAIDNSVLFGTLSIACWLGAQLPQTITNYRLQSVEGLSLTFLFNWFMGDGCNLLGCILTHQLPFQTYLAVYFVFVDSVLLTQYFHYGEKKKKTRMVKTELDIEEEGGDEDTSPLLGHDRSGSLSRSYASISTLGFNRGRSANPTSRYNTVERIAANVASAAEQLSEQARSASRQPSRDVDEEIAGALLASMYSERSAASNVSTVSKAKRSKQKQVSWTPNLEEVQRGRSPGGSQDEVAEPENIRNSSFSRSTPRSSKVRSATSTTSIVFMGVWALFGLQSYRGGAPFSSPNSITPISIPQGKVLQPLSDTIDLNKSSMYAFTSQPSLPRPLLFVSNNRGTDYEPMEEVDGPLTPQPPETPGMDKERIIGRISAWICTTFYLTCRMPQIWMNYLRKSCQGLSPFLFIFAFMGNFFYVLSILASPEARGPGATAFLLESLPYLVGSGGTLSFDIVILTQSFIYRGRKPRRITLPGVNKSRSFGSLASRSVSRSRTRDRSISIGGNRNRG